MLLKKTLILIFSIFIISFSISAQTDSTADLTKGKTFKEEFNIQNAKIKELKSEISQINKDISILVKEYKLIMKNLDNINKNLIETLDEAKITELKASKDETLLKKFDTHQKINELIMSKKDKKNEVIRMKQDKDFVVADGTLNWNKTFNIKNDPKYKSGKWHIAVKAKDNLNNYSNVEKINIKINPKSDIPSLSVINPVNNGRVTSTLKVVGTAIDDDGIDRVIMFIDDDKTEIKCKGTDFWYYDLDTKNLEEGNHKLSFKTYDINGVESKLYIVTFKLDKNSPALIIQSKPEQVMISGKIKIEGTASDGNGINTVEYSVDDRKNFIKIQNFKYTNKEQTNVSWQLDIDSENLIDGLQTIWIKAIDKTGSLSYESFTFLIDHKKPIIGFQYPKDKGKVDGIFNVYGYAYDNIGVKRVTIDIKGPGVSNKLQEITLKPGNPLWSQKVEASDLKDGTYQLIASVEDISGNIVTQSIDITIDHSIDKPQLELSSFKKNDKFSSTLPVYGKVYDDDGVKEVNLKILKNNNAIIEEKIPAKYSFYKDIDLTNFSTFEEGEYILELTPYDINDAAGKTVSTGFFIERSYPKFDKNLINGWAGKTYNKLNLGFNVIKFGELKMLNYSLLNGTDNSEIVPLKELKFKKGKEAGIYEIDPIILDPQKDKIETNGLVLIKINAIDSADNGTTIIVPLILDTNNPVITLPVIDQNAGMIKDEEITISDNLILEKIKVNIISNDKNTPPVQEDLLTETSKEYIMKVKSQDNKFIEYTVNLEAYDQAGNVIKTSQKIFFKQGDSESYKLTLKINRNTKSVYSEKPLLFIESNNIGLEKYDSCFYAFIPDNFKEIRLDSADIKKNFTQLNELNRIYFIEFSQEEKVAMKKGNIPCNIQFVKKDNKSEQMAISLFNDIMNPTADLLWPPPFMQFNKNFSIFFKAFDDSNTVSADYFTDSIIPKTFAISDFETNILNKIKDPDAKKEILNYYVKDNQNYTLKDNLKSENLINIINMLKSLNFDIQFKNINISEMTTLKSIKVPNLNPLKAKELISLQDYINDQKIKININDKLINLDVPIDNLNDGNHVIVLRIKDKSGRETIKKTVFTIDKKIPEINLWAFNPALELEKVKQPTDKTKKEEPKKNPQTKKGQKEEAAKPEEKKDTEPAKETQIDRINGLITLRGDAKDENNLYGIVVIYNGKETIAEGNDLWEKDYDLAKIDNIKLKEGDQIPYTLEFYAIDLAGNKNVVKKDIIIDQKQDTPIVLINKPAVNNQRFSQDVNLAGIAFDDDGIDYVQYRLNNIVTLTKEKVPKKIDSQSWIKLAVDKVSGKWSTIIPNNQLESKIHYLEVQAVDIYGMKSEIKKIQFHLDKENPTVFVNSPANGEYIKGESTIVGEAIDPNEIDSVEISTNYGWSYVFAEGTQKWNYKFNSNSIPDGPIRVLIKTKDKAGSEGFSFGLYNIDNTNPEINVLLPKDGMKINNTYKIIGRAKDNIGIKSVEIKITSGNNNMLQNVNNEGFAKVSGKEAWSYEIDTKTWDITKPYNLVARVTDLSGNTNENSILFFVDPKSDLPVVDLIQPQPSQHMTGEVLNFFGNAYDDEAVEGVYIKVDDNEIIKTKGTTTWSFALPTINLKTGLHKLEIYAKEKNDTGKEVLSNKITRNFYFDESGPVVRVESHINGMPVGHRPWLLGSSGYYIKNLELKLKKQIQEMKYEEFKQKFKRNPELVPQIKTIPVKSSEVNSLKQNIFHINKIKKIYMSYDNGKTYIKNKNMAIPPKWKIRLQTQNLEEGTHMLQIKAITLKDEERIEYFKVILDKSIPTVIIDKPNENSELNEKIVIRGSTNDNGNVEEVQVALKRFDKNLGSLPKFVQGIYFWAQAFGGPWVSGGFGLSFFDDIVRLEGLFGWIPTYENIRDMGQDPETTGPGLLRTVPNEPGYDPRFSGFVTGGKLLARVIDIPFEFFFGEDAKNFSISAEIGCGFYWYSGYGSATNEKNNDYYYLKRPDLHDGYQASKDGKFLAGFMYQIDYFKVQRYGPFRKFALYFEHSFLFIASEIEGGLIMQFGFGMRNAIF